MRISDWSSDVCSSDLELVAAAGIAEVEDSARVLVGRLARRRIDGHPANRIPHDTRAVDSHAGIAWMRVGLYSFHHDCCLSLLLSSQRWGFQPLEGPGFATSATKGPRGVRETPE